MLMNDAMCECVSPFANWSERGAPLCPFSAANFGGGIGAGLIGMPGGHFGVRRQMVDT